MERRAFIGAVTGCLLAAPLAAQAQQEGKVPPKGFLLAGSSPNSALVDAFRQRLRDLGWVEGKNIVVEYRSAEGRADKLAAALAAELVQLRVDLIVASPTAGAVAARKATETIPIVMISVADPVRFSSTWSSTSRSPRPSV